MPGRKHGHDEHCRDLHRALSHAKSILHANTLSDTLGTDPQSAVFELRQGHDVSGTEEIARIEQALREHGCTV